MALLSRRFLARRPRHQIVIVGGNFAGISAARAIAPEAATVTVIDGGAQAQWLPNVHELLSRHKQADQLRTDRRALFSALGHEFLCAEVAGIDRLQQRVITSHGEWRDYDALILATGSISQDFGVPGAATHALHPRSVESAARAGHALNRLAALPGGRDVVIVGGGIEGVEMLGEILRAHGGSRRFNLHLVEQSPRLFPRFPGLHQRLQQQMQGEVELHCGQRVREVHADAVELENGQRLASRLTLWCAGRRSTELAASVDLDVDSRSGDALASDSLQSVNDRSIFLAGDSSQLSSPLEKQAYYAQDMGEHAAKNALRLLAGKPLLAFNPLRKPALMTFGDRDGILFYGDQALASPGLIALKEAIYQYGFNLWQPPQSGSELWRMARDIRRGMAELDAWRLFLKSRDTAIFRAR